MIQVGMHEAKTNLSELVEQLHAGEEIQFTKRGTVVAELSLPLEYRKKRAKELLKRLEAIRSETGNISNEDIVSWKNEGRM